MIRELKNENKPETKGFYKNSGYIYLKKDLSKFGHYKITYVNNIDLNSYSLEIVSKFPIFDKEFTEKTIHYALQPFKIKNDKDESPWLYLKDDFELAYTIKIMKECIQFVNSFNIYDYENLNKINVDIHQELHEIDKNYLKLNFNRFCYALQNHTLNLDE